MDATQTGNRTELAAHLQAAIAHPQVKQRIYGILTRLTPDQWLEHDLQVYADAAQSESAQWFDSISFLNWYAHTFKPTRYLEVGVRRGRSMAQVLTESPQTTAYGFDLWIPNYADADNPGPEFVLSELTRLGVHPLPTFIRGNSHETLPAFFANPNHPQQFDLINIDGDHTYEGAKLDLDIAFEHLAPGGALLFDDIHHRAHPELYPLWEGYKERFPNYLFIEDLWGTGTGVAFKPPLTKLRQSLTRAVSLPSRADALPIHFFTIVLNGEPFIRYHLEAFKQLPFRWHWHLVEGVADLKHDTAWSVKTGGRISDALHHRGRSNDGTREYLDQLAQQYPDQVTLYRKPEGEFWDGKREMVNAPLANIQEECLLWQVDADELWTPEQLAIAHQMFLEDPDKTAAFYWCWYFVGPNQVVSSRHCYSQNPKQEWLRTWRYKPGYTWATHEPPRLVTPAGQDVARLNPFMHDDTGAEGLIFQHYAYVTSHQLQFKEQYYGYENALIAWKTLQEQEHFPVLLSQYFPWVQDSTTVDTATACGVVPIAQREGDRWHFLSAEELQQTTLQIQRPFPQIVVDGIIFETSNSGIARVWKSLLSVWAETDFAQHLVILDRGKTAPYFPQFTYRAFPSLDFKKTGGDAKLLQQICDQLGADLFISTYHTAPLATPSVFLVHDMIPEVMNTNLDSHVWDEKRYAILQASSYLTVSQNTARDLVKFFPHLAPDSITVAPNGIDESFIPAAPEKIQEFQQKYNLQHPYFLFVGIRRGYDQYKNAIHLVKALQQLPNKQDYSLVFVGGKPELEEEIIELAEGLNYYHLFLTDEELKTAYSGAIALVYPSRYEGFGLPILEAMACACPVITCRNSAIPEVAGEAVLYVDPLDTQEMIDALHKVQKPEIRESLIAAGLKQSQQFSWAKTAEIIQQALMQAAKESKNNFDGAIAQVWAELRRFQAQTQLLQPQLKKTRNELKRTQNQLQKTQAQLQQAEGVIEAMETSKFWKIRSAWFRLKQRLGFKGE